MHTRNRIIEPPKLYGFSSAKRSMISCSAPAPRAIRPSQQKKGDAPTRMHLSLIAGRADLWMIRAGSALNSPHLGGVYISTSHTHIPLSCLTGLATCAEKVSHLGTAGTAVHDAQREPTKLSSGAGSGIVDLPKHAQPGDQAARDG